MYRLKVGDICKNGFGDTLLCVGTRSHNTDYAFLRMYITEDGEIALPYMDLKQYNSDGYNRQWTHGEIAEKEKIVAKVGHIEVKMEDNE